MVEDYYYRMLASSTFTLFLISCMVGVAVYTIRELLPSGFHAAVAGVTLFLAGLLGHIVCQDFGLLPTGDRALDTVMCALMGMACVFVIGALAYRVHFQINKRA